MHGPCLVWNGVRVQLGEGASRQHSLLLDFGKVELLISINLCITLMINHWVRVYFNNTWVGSFCLALSMTDSTLFSRLDWCNSGWWYCKLKTINVFAVADVDVEECVDDSMTTAFSSSVSVSNFVVKAKRYLVCSLLLKEVTLLKNIAKRRHYGPRRWLLWPVILVRLG